MRAARPFTADLRLGRPRHGAGGSRPERARFEQLNRFFNIGAFNPGGAEGARRPVVPQQRSRQEGFLYWLAWTAQNGVSLF